MMTSGYLVEDRSVIRLSGADVRGFLQGLVSNNVARLDSGVIYAALLSPQGKYLFDFFLASDGADVLLDVSRERSQALAQRLSLYRLRADVVIEHSVLAVVAGDGPQPEAVAAFADPRHPALGWRAIVDDPAALLAGMDPMDPNAATTRRVALGVPEAGFELIPDESYILEMGFERLNGVDFRKGCYVGQEVTARMKHKTRLKKGLAAVGVEGTAPPPGSKILCEGKVAGKLHTVAGDRGLAWLRFDRAGQGMTAGGALLRLIEEAW
jgi:folate-binding protein YgfZ